MRNHSILQPILLVMCTGQNRYQFVTYGKTMQSKLKKKKTKKKTLYLNNALLLTNQAFQFNPIKYLQLIARKHKTNEKMKQMGVGNKHTGSFGSYQNNTVELYVWVGLEKECCSQVCFSSWIKKEKKKKKKNKTKLHV